MGAVTYIADTLRNLASGLGTSRDKAASAEFHFAEMSPQQLEAMYRGDWTAGKAVDIPAFDSVRGWRNWQADKNQIEAIEEEERRLDLPGKLLEAMILARLWGGAALVMGVGADDPREELAPDRIGRGDLRYLHVMARAELVPSDLRRDPEDKWFREPVYWTMDTETSGQVEIHPSRVVVLTGRRRPRQTFALDPWGDSILQRIADAVKNAGLASQTIAQLLAEAKLDIVRVPDLMEHLATAEYTRRLTDRFRTAMDIKSSTNTLLLDKEEEYEQKQVAFSQLPEVLQQYLIVVCGAADVPATRFIGQSPSGLNATGESDLKNYYDGIGAEQRLTLTPRLSRLDEVLIRSATGKRDPAIHYAWAPLWQTSEKEASEIEKSRAESFTKIGASGLLPSRVASKVLVNSMIESGRYPGIEAAMEEYEAATGEFDPDAGGPDDPDEDVPPAIDPKTGQPVADAAPRTLYVHRKVLNGAAIIKWAKAQGFKSTLKASDLHVTLIYSKAAVDWMKAGQAWQSKMEIPEGGPRLMDQFDDARVLLFGAAELEWRHEEFKRAGASWDHDAFQPHITISYDPDAPDLATVEPYQGVIRLGPEIFAEINDDWEKGKG